MESLLKGNVDPEDLKKYEGLYSQQMQRGCVGEKTQFDYAECLVRSPYQQDMKKGVALLEDLLRSEKDDESKRDYLFYIAIGHARLKEYERALKYVNAVLHIEPTNRYAKSLHSFIRRKMERDGLMGMAIVGGAAVVVGGLVGLGFLALKK